MFTSIYAMRYYNNSRQGRTSSNSVWLKRITLAQEEGNCTGHDVGFLEACKRKVGLLFGRHIVEGVAMFSPFPLSPGSLIP